MGLPRTIERLDAVEAVASSAQSTATAAAAAASTAQTTADGAASTASAAQTTANAAQAATQALDMSKAASGILAITRGGTGNATGLAASATKLATARTFRTNLASTSTASFDGSSNVTPGVTGTLPIGNGGTGNTTGNAATATKLATARTLTFTGDATGSGSFDGSANVSIALTVSGVGGTPARKDETLTTAVAANTNYAVPSYVVGGKKLKVYLDGVLCVAGASGTYIEQGTTGAASTAIRFNQVIPVGYTITAEVAA